MISTTNNSRSQHGIIMNPGLNVREPVCGKIMVGNTRTTSQFGVKGSEIDSGYDLSNPNMFILNTEMMNMDEREIWIGVTVTYELLMISERAGGKATWSDRQHDARLTTNY